MALVDLSKWDFAVEFRLYEAAALIVGIDPAEIYTNTKPARDNPRIYDYHEHPQIKPVADRMEHDFLTACDLYEAMRDGKWKFSTDEPLSERLLRNREMELVPVKIGSWGLPLDSVTQMALDTWHDSDDFAMYETAKFTRKELSRWLSAICLKSVYQFDQGQSENIQTSADRPLATRERDTLLTIIAVLCKEAKIPYDKPSKAAGLIQSTAAGMGLSIGETTIEGHLKKLPNALAGRMK